MRAPSAVHHLADHLFLLRLIFLHPELILQQFVSVITESVTSMESLDDEISELILSAEDSIDKVKNMHSKISTKSVGAL